MRPTFKPQQCMPPRSLSSVPGEKNVWEDYCKQGIQGLQFESFKSKGDNMKEMQCMTSIYATYMINNYIIFIWQH